MHLSLQARVTALVVAVVMAIVIGKSAADLHTSAAERETATLYHLQMVTDMQSKALAGALWDFNVDHVTSILDGLAREKSFVHAAVVDAKGKLVTEYPAGKASGTAQPDSAAHNVWSLAAPSVYEDGPRRETVGTLHATYSRQALDDAWWHQIIQSIETMVAVALVTMAAVVLSLRFLTRPLRALTVAMGRLAAGDTSVPIAATGRHDEIGAMARAVDVFKQNMIKADQLAAEQAAARAARSRRQDAMERDTEAFGVSVAAVMTKLSGSTGVMRGAAEAMTRASTTVHEAATRTSDDAGKSSQDLASTATAVEELTSSFAEIARQVATAAEVSRMAVQRAEASQVTIHSLEEFDDADRRRGQADRQHCLADQFAGAECHDRGGARGRRRQGLCGGGRRGEGAGGANRAGDLGDRQPDRRGARCDPGDHRGDDRNRQHDRTHGRHRERDGDGDRSAERYRAGDCGEGHRRVGRDRAIGPGHGRGRSDRGADGRGQSARSSPASPASIRKPASCAAKLNGSW